MLFRSITLLCPLARALHISVDVLLGFQEKMTKEECLEALKEPEKLFSSHKAEEAVRYCRELLKQYPTDAYLKLRIAGLYVPVSYTHLIGSPLENVRCGYSDLAGGRYLSKCR